MQNKIFLRSLAVILSFVLSCPFPLSQPGASVCADTGCLAPSALSETGLVGSYENMEDQRTSHPVKLQRVQESFFKQDGSRLRSSGSLVMSPAGKQLLSARISYDDIFKSVFSRTHESFLWVSRKTMGIIGFFLPGAVVNALYLFGVFPAQYLAGALAWTLTQVWIVCGLFGPIVLGVVFAVLMSKINLDFSSPFITTNFYFGVYGHQYDKLKIVKLDSRELDFDKIEEALFPSCTLPFFYDKDIMYKETRYNGTIALLAKLDTHSLYNYANHPKSLKGDALLDKLAVILHDIEQSPVGRAYLASLTDLQKMSMDYLGFDRESGEIYFTPIEEAIKLYLSDKSAGTSFFNNPFSRFFEAWPIFLAKKKQYLQDLEDVGPGGDTTKERVVVGQDEETETITIPGHYDYEPVDYYGNERKVWIDTTYDYVKTGRMIDRMGVVTHIGPKDKKIAEIKETYNTWLKSTQPFAGIDVTGEQMTSWVATMVNLAGRLGMKNGGSDADIDVFVNKLAVVFGYYDRAVTEAA